jgi:hypothetical protein
MFGLEGVGGFGELGMSHWAASRSAFLTKHYSGGQIKEDEMGRVCGTYTWQEEHIPDFDEEKSGRHFRWKTYA